MLRARGLLKEEPVVEEVEAETEVAAELPVLPVKPVKPGTVPTAPLKPSIKK